jgi:hypothetical protein
MARNPFRSEAEAYRFLLLTVGYFALIVAAAAIETWLGLVVFVGLTAAAIWFWMRSRSNEPAMKASVRQVGNENERRILVIANETVGGGALRNCIRKKSEGVQENVLVVSPSLSSPVRHWASDEGPGRAEAQERLDTSLALLRQAGISARGEVGDAEPLQAIEDALRTFGAEEIIISTHPEGKSKWLERGIVTEARERFALPITHVIVDVDEEREDLVEDD